MTIENMGVHPCGLCARGQLGMDNFCYGCNQFICDECSVNGSLGPVHDPEEHLLTEEEYNAE